MKYNILINFRMKTTVCKDCEITVNYKTAKSTVTSKTSMLWPLLNFM